MNLLPIVAMLTRATTAQKRSPRIRLQVDGEPVALTRCGSRSRYPGSVAVGNTLHFFGRIGLDGVLVPSHLTPPRPALPATRRSNEDCEED